MRVLAVDTSSEFASLAAFDGEEMSEMILRSPDGFAHILFQQIEALLERRGWRLEDVDCFAAAAGPGSFTGVRVALSAVKGLAEALGKPVVAVSNLEAMAFYGDAAVRAPLLDARRGEIFGAVYDAELNVVVPERVAKFAEWLPHVPGEAQFLVVDPTPFAAALPREARVVSRALAGAVARIARDRALRGMTADPAGVDANYVRRADAELKWVDR